MLADDLLLAAKSLLYLLQPVSSLKWHLLQFAPRVIGIVELVNI